MGLPVFREATFAQPKSRRSSAGATASVRAVGSNRPIRRSGQDVQSSATATDDAGRAARRHAHHVARRRARPTDARASDNALLRSAIRSSQMQSSQARAGALDAMDWSSDQVADTRDSAATSPFPFRRFVDSVIDQSSQPIGLEDFDEDDLESLTAMPPLRRMGGRSITEAPRSGVEPNGNMTSISRDGRTAPSFDGLGDRRRSYTPESEGDTWETLLTTITPDPSLPSAATSFASGAQSFSNSSAENGLESSFTSVSSAVSDAALRSRLRQRQQQQQQRLRHNHRLLSNLRSTAEQSAAQGISSLRTPHTNQLSPNSNSEGSPTLEGIANNFYYDPWGNCEDIPGNSPDNDAEFGGDESRSGLNQGMINTRLLYGERTAMSEPRPLEDTINEGSRPQMQHEAQRQTRRSNDRAGQRHIAPPSALTTAPIPIVNQATLHLHSQLLLRFRNLSHLMSDTLELLLVTPNREMSHLVDQLLDEMASVANRALEQSQSVLSGQVRERERL